MLSLPKLSPNFKKQGLFSRMPSNWILEETVSYQKLPFFCAELDCLLFACLERAVNPDGLFCLAQQIVQDLQIDSQDLQTFSLNIAAGLLDLDKNELQRLKNPDERKDIFSRFFKRQIFIPNPSLELQDYFWHEANTSHSLYRLVSRKQNSLPILYPYVIEIQRLKRPCPSCQESFYNVPKIIRFLYAPLDINMFEFHFYEVLSFDEEEANTLLQDLAEYDTNLLALL